MLQKKYSILLVEDEENLQEALKLNLELEGYEISSAFDGTQALKTIQREYFDLIILDVMLPGVDGISVTETIRVQNNDVPILILSAKNSSADRVLGLKKGADDYLTKPFSMLELLKKVEVFLRRTKKIPSESVLEYRLNKLTFSYKELKITDEMGSFNLTQKEADLLKFFCEWPNKVLKREEVLINVWGKDDFFLGRSMDVYISKLRKYFKSDPDIVLETIHGIGFRFSIPVT